MSPSRGAPVSIPKTMSSPTFATTRAGASKHPLDRLARIRPRLKVAIGQKGNGMLRS
jgi:hypothetical protein